MFALAPPNIVQQAADTDQPDIIEIVGTRSAQTLKIDRRTYQVQQTPHSQQKDTLQLLRGLPAITITPDDQINLLGASNVTVLIDGHETRTDLHTLHGSDIERIEIITNPSAQYSAVGTGGIINIVLRKKGADGLSGNASIEGSSLGRAEGIASVKYKKGKWTYEIAPDGTAGSSRRSTYQKRRAIEGAPGGPATINTEDGGGRSRAAYAGLGAKATYELDSRTNISAQAYGGAGHSNAINNAEFTGLTPDFRSFSQRQTDRDWANFAAGFVTFDHKGKREGETIKGSVALFGNPRAHETTAAQLSNGDNFISDRRFGSLYSEDKIDWEHPIGKKQILSIGGSWRFLQEHSRYRFISSDAASFGSDTFDDYRGIESTISTYATFQQQAGRWTIMPGLRMEQNIRHVSSPGLEPVRNHQTDLFPTLHVADSLSKALNLTLSYSKRIDRPRIDQLRPYPVQTGVLTVTEGNPHLMDQTTDAYEANLHYHRGKLDAGVIVYDRETSRLWNQSYAVNLAGQNVVTTVNVGHRSDRGAEFDVNTPLISRVKLSASLNLFDSRVPIDAVTSRSTVEQFRFTSNSTLEWDGPDRGKKPADIAQLTWHYESPATQFQFRMFPWQQLTASYTHSFNRTLSLTATADTGALHNGHQLIAPLVQEYYAVHNRAEIKLKLMKTLGKP